MNGALAVASPSSETNISTNVSLAVDRRPVNSADKKGGRKLRPSAVYIGLSRSEIRKIWRNLAEILKS